MFRVVIKKVPTNLMKSCEEVCESEERDFLWQERVYSRNEIVFYSNPSNCITAESKRIHDEVKDLDSRAQKWLFSFSKLPSEDYRSMVSYEVVLLKFFTKILSITNILKLSLCK